MGATTMAEVGHQDRRRAIATTSSARSRRCRASSSPRCSSKRLRATVTQRLRQRAAASRAARRGRRRAGRRSTALDDVARLPFTRRPTCATTIRSACSRGRAAALARLHASSGTTGKPTVVGYTRRRHRDLGRPDGALDGLRRRRGPATSCTTPTATACSPAAWARTTAPSASAPPSCRCRADRPSGRSR